VSEHAEMQLHSLTLSKETREKFERMAIPTVDKNKKALVDADIVVVAVKPQILKQVLKYFDVLPAP
jgi:pyrroline-5-carboxylate reductase